MKRRWLGLSVVAVGLGLVSGCSNRPASLTPERVVPYAQPAVVMIQAFGDLTITGPGGASTRKQYESAPATGLSGLSPSGSAFSQRSSLFQDTSSSGDTPPWRWRWGLGGSGSSLTPAWRLPSLAPAAAPALVANEYQRDRSAGVIEDSKSQADYCWEKIAEAPDKYLKASDAETRRLEDRPYAHGSGFAVSREGILLTNAHVVSDPDDLSPTLSMLADPINQTVAELTREFGSEPPAALAKKLALSLGEWFAKQTEVKATFKEARMVLNRKKDPFRDLLTGSSPLERLQGREDPAQKIRDMSVPAQVLKIGEPFPGQDVAVLKVDLRDQLICLPLGDSDAVQVGTPVHAMGYPGAAVIQGAMEEEAAYRVIAHDGIVDQRLPMVRGWEAFHMTADINHGDSGGAVIDKAGRVIGLNVAGNPDAPAQTVAVPINLAKGFLTQAGVRIDLGPVSEHWTRGQQEFGRENYAAALKEFEEVARLQNGGFERRLLSETNEYVDEMIDQCRKLGKLGPDTPELPTGKPDAWKWARTFAAGHPLLVVLLVIALARALARR
jgi:S1-C subfamily serine protease